MTCQNGVVTSNLYEKSTFFALFHNQQIYPSTMLSVTVYYTSLVELTRLGQIICYVTLKANGLVEG